MDLARGLTFVGWTPPKVADSLKLTMETIVSRNPATGVVLKELTATPPAELDSIFSRSRVAQIQWARTPIKKRAHAIRQLREAILNHTDEIIDLISAETGKPRFEALVSDVVPAIDTLTYFAQCGPSALKPENIPMRLMKHRRSQLTYWPLGTVAVISPWNYPFLLPIGDIVMALIAGNAVVFKPSEATPLVGLKIQQLCDEAGIPENVIQTVIGSGPIGAAIIQQRPAKIFFTGSVATGKKVMAAAAEHLIPVNLELGGKDAMLILPDADLDYAASAALWGGFSNSGQACASVERILIHESKHEEFTQRLKEKVSRLRQFPDQLGATDLGAITYEKQKITYETHIEEARIAGAAILTGGKLSNDRRYLEPTIITGPGIEKLNVYNEETFGPVVAVTTYRTISEAIQKVNNSRYGLLASIICKNLGMASEIASQLEVGTVTINEVLYTAGIPETPWGGVKESGIGRTHSEAGLYEFVNVRHVHKPRSRLFTFKSLWWFPYSEYQFLTFRSFIELYRNHWFDKIRAFPHVLWNFTQFMKKERRL